MRHISRRTVLAAAPAVFVAARTVQARTLDPGEKLAAAARRQIGVTRSYDAAYRQIPYPDGDVPRSTGVCADVVVRAARDALGLDLQKLVHEDMLHAFDSYPSRKAWRLRAPDPNIDHRRVLNLEVYWLRQGGRVWRPDGYYPGFMAPHGIEPGDLLTWRLPPRGDPHVGMVVRSGSQVRIVHNIGAGVEENDLFRMAFARLYGVYRWPRTT